MLVFIDESGTPHPNDASAHPTVLAVCIRERDMRPISAQLYAMKRRLLGSPDRELKALRLITRSTFRRKPDFRTFVDEFFDLVGLLPVTVFAITMDRPVCPLPDLARYLPNQFRYLLQRIDELCVQEDEMATILFDGVEMSDLALPFGTYLNRSTEGQQMLNIADAPYFVDSRVTAGIQIADMMVGVVRMWWDNDLMNAIPEGDEFLGSVARYYRAVASRTVDLRTDRAMLYGMYRMPERAHLVHQEHFGEVRV